MKILQIALVMLVLLLNLATAQPAWADKPKVSKNPDYIQITNKLEQLQQKESQSAAPELQQQIDELHLQQSTIESGINWGQCQNETGKTLAVYGPKTKDSKSSYDNEIYFLAAGETTPNGWDCSGIYLPRGIKAAGVDLPVPIAYQIFDGTKLVVKTNADRSDLTFNVAPAKVIKAGEQNWPFPNMSQAFIASRIPNDLSGFEPDD